MDYAAHYSSIIRKEFFKPLFEFSATAKTQQARLLCLPHNLMTLMEEEIRKRSGIVNQAEPMRRAKALPSSPSAKPCSNHQQSGIIEHAIERLSQRTVKFIRWLKNPLDLERRRV